MRTLALTAATLAAAEGGDRRRGRRCRGGQDPSAEFTEELREIRRIVAERQAIVSEALLVVDATTGQNGIARARGLSEAVQPTGAVLTNLDATRWGGIVLAVEEELGIPSRWWGSGGPRAIWRCSTQRLLSRDGLGSPRPRPLPVGGGVPGSDRGPPRG